MEGAPSVPRPWEGSQHGFESALEFRRFLGETEYRRETGETRARKASIEASIKIEEEAGSDWA